MIVKNVATNAIAKHLVHLANARTVIANKVQEIVHANLC